jgi:hypothetical protein
MADLLAEALRQDSVGGTRSLATDQRLSAVGEPERKKTPAKRRRGQIGIWKAGGEVTFQMGLN